MIDYNDGTWHDWAGGECPVHPKSEIEGYWKVEDSHIYPMAKSAIYNAGLAGELNFEWGGQTRLHLFRVIKPYVEPREFWVNEYVFGFSYLNDSKAKADENATDARIRCIRVREVLE